MNQKRKGYKEKDIVTQDKETATIRLTSAEVAAYTKKKRAEAKGVIKIGTEGEPETPKPHRRNPIQGGAKRRTRGRKKIATQENAGPTQPIVRGFPKRKGSRKAENRSQKKHA